MKPYIYDDMPSEEQRQLMEEHARRWFGWSDELRDGLPDRPEKAEKDARYHAQLIEQNVYGMVGEMFGRAGLAAMPEFFWAELHANIVALYCKAWDDANTASIIEAGFESSRRTGRMVSAMLQAAGKGEDETRTCRRMMAAGSDIDLGLNDADDDNEESGDEAGEE